MHSVPLRAFARVHQPYRPPRVNTTDLKPIPIQPIPGVPGSDADDEIGLYEIRKKIYPRSVTGTFANWRVALVIATQVIFYGLPWLYWNDRQAVLFDLARASSTSSASCSGRRTSST